jgi:hypothetical protein
MKLHKFKELRVVVKDCFIPKYNGQTFTVKFAELNRLKEPILYLEIPNMVNLLTVDLSQIDYVKVFDFSVIQYYDTVLQSRFTARFHCEDKMLQKLGSFDIYRKEKDILSLVK